MPKRLHLLLPLWICFLAACLSGCVTQPSQPEKPVLKTVQTPPAEEESIYRYIASMSSGTLATPEAQKKEVLKLNQHLISAAPEESTLPIRMRLAALYGLPNSSVRDPAKAQNLLDQLLKESALENEHRVLLGLLHDYVADTTKLNAKTRDEQKRADALQSRLDNTLSKVDSAQQRADLLQRKLDELKNIEKTMLDRGQGSTK